MENQAKDRESNVQNSMLKKFKEDWDEGIHRKAMETLSLSLIFLVKQYLNISVISPFT